MGIGRLPARARRFELEIGMGWRVSAFSPRSYGLYEWNDSKSIACGFDLQRSTLFSQYLLHLGHLILERLHFVSPNKDN